MNPRLTQELSSPSTKKKHKRLYFCFLGAFLSSFPAAAQEEESQPQTNPDTEASAPVKLGTEEDSQDGKAVKSRVRDVIAGTGILVTLPRIDVGMLTTTPNSQNIFSKLESSASGWLAEPKIGVGTFSKSVALDLLVGLQTSSLSGKRLAEVPNFENESVDNPNLKTLNPEEAYNLSQNATLVEGNARIRFANGDHQAGFAATAVFAPSVKLYSSVPTVGASYVVLIGPQYMYEQRQKEDLYRFGAALQFSATGSQRNAFALKLSASYGFLVNDPYLRVTEKKVVKSKTTVQKQIVTKREQNIRQMENVNFIFDSQVINFKFNKFELSEKSHAFISGLGQIFSAQRTDWKKLIIEGHTDSKGDDAYNKSLSQQRADEVKRVLLENGLLSEDVDAIGLGEERLLINPEKTDLDFARNRRVEIRVEGIRDARYLHRSITRLQSEIYPPKTQPKNNPESQNNDGE